MFDLDTLHQMNERAHQEAVWRANEKTGAASGQTHSPVFPLSILARRLVVGPPSLSHLIDLIENSNTIAEFFQLVKEFLPEHEAFIMAQDEDGRIREFAYYFNERYFPLSDNLDMNELTLGDFVNQIPVDLMGFSGDDYSEFADFRDGYILMLSLIERLFLYDDGGGRVPILDRVIELVGRDVVELIPPEGWTAKDLHRRLDDTDYKGVAAFADWVTGDTGCWQLDATYENYGPEEWSRRVVDELTEQWPKVMEIQDAIYNMSVWLEEDLRANFLTLLRLMVDKEVFIVPKEQLALPLDENAKVIGKEVKAEGDD